MASFLPARSLALLVLLAFVVVAYGQSASGFVNIDCGKPEGYYDTDNETGLVYSSDFEFIDTGEVHNVSSEFTTSSNSQIDDLRSFPNGNRNCYVLRPVTRDNKYLVRATFFYGNYDGQDRPPQFDLYLGINLWSTVKLSTSSVPDSHEIIAFATSDSMSVCLANTNTGTPFISGLELRPLNDTEYSVLFDTSRTRSLILYYRGDFGGTGPTRYPADIFDRIWQPFTDSDWRILETQSAINTNNDFDPPLAVMRTAVTPRTGSSLYFSWDLSKVSLPSTSYSLALHFAEVQKLSANDTRIFNITLTDGDGINFFNNLSLNQTVNTIYSLKPGNIQKKLAVSILQTGHSTLPPILNAVEVFFVLDITESETDDNDVDAINHIKALYRQQKNWMGDPCLPKKFTWDGLSCNYASSNSPRIISLNLSSSGLVGELPIFLTNLTELESLDLSGNNLTGSVPDFLADLPRLTLLDLRDNKFEGTIPKSLLDKSAAGILQLRTGGNPGLCTNSDSCQANERRKSKQVLVIAVALGGAVLVLILVAVIIFWMLKRRNQATKNTQSGNGIQPRFRNGSFRMSSLKPESRQFTFADLVRITSNFNNGIGKGGFGSVYHGMLEDNTEVAVKMLSRSSSQGTREFQTEAQLLTRIHHRNLVPLVGYCNDMNHIGLVYEYMAGGSLKDHLSGKIQNARALSWKQRVGMALEAAQGLEYLHRGCKPPIIHRDVKTSNILLTSNLEARIADFGLSKIFSHDSNTHVSTRVAGTPGYLDPEYSITNKLNEKSDVYSFGVVLLELITGHPAIIRSTENVHISRWVQPSFENGKISEIVDKAFQEDFNINSIWKALEIAFACVAPISIQRPSMSEVEILLKECFELETIQERSQNSSYVDLDTSSTISMKIASINEISITNPTAR